MVVSITPVILREVAADRLILGLWRKWLHYCFLKNYFVGVGAGSQSEDVQVQRTCRNRDEAGIACEWGTGSEPQLCRELSQCSPSAPFPLRGVRRLRELWLEKTLSQPLICFLSLLLELL